MATSHLNNITPDTRVLSVERDALIRSFNAIVEKPHYRPDLYPEQLDFTIAGAVVQAEILDGLCLHAMIALGEATEESSLPSLLAMFSGIEKWEALDRKDPLVGEHFPWLSPSASMNSFYASRDRSALALVQVGTPLGPIVVWLQSSEYPSRLEAYRHKEAR